MQSETLCEIHSSDFILFNQPKMRDWHWHTKRFHFVTAMTPNTITSDISTVYKMQFVNGVFGNGEFVWRNTHQK